MLGTVRGANSFHPPPLRTQTHSPRAFLCDWSFDGQGGIANFTDIFKTFKGIIHAFGEFKDEIAAANMKIFVRRAGPNYIRGLKSMRVRFALPVCRIAFVSVVSVERRRRGKTPRAPNSPISSRLLSNPFACRTLRTSRGWILLSLGRR